MTPSPKPIRILAAADLHLGRHISSVGEIPQEEVSPKRAFDRLISFACNPVNQIDCVAISGDLIDRDIDFFAAFSPLQEGFKLLKKSGIPVVLTAGNHDAISLPKVMDALEDDLKKNHVYFLGRGGTWSSCTLRLQGREISFDGWSFPAPLYLENPMNAFKPEENGSVRIGLFHGQVPAVSDCAYAPASLSDFLKTSHIAWIFGHIHTPTIFSQSPLVFYAGTPQPIASSETGGHGAHVITVELDGSLQREFVPLASAEFLPLEIDITAKGPHELENLVIAAVRQFEGGAHLRHAIHPITLTGTTTHSTQFLAAGELLAGKHIARAIHENRDHWVHRCTCLATPPVDLKALSESTTLPAQLARDLMDPQQVTAEIRMEMENCLRERPYFPEDQMIPMKDLELQELVREVGSELLGQFLLSKGGGQ